MQKYMLMFMLAASAICVVIGIAKILIVIVKSSRWEGGASMRIKTFQNVILEESANLKSDAKPYDASDADEHSETDQTESDQTESDQPESDQTESDQTESDQTESELPSSENNAGE